MSGKNTETGGKDELRKPDDPVDKLLEIGLSDELLHSLGNALSGLRLARYGSGETIYRVDSDVEALYLVLDGRIKLMTYTPDGHARIVRLHKRGSVLGLNGLMDEKHDHTAVAIDEVTLYILPLRTIRNIEGEDSETYLRLLEYSHEYLKQADTWITEFSTGEIRTRVARLVLYLMTHDDSTDDHDVSLLTVNEMSEIIGATPESVSRVLADFKRRQTLSPVDGAEADVFRCDRRTLEQEAGG